MTPDDWLKYNLGEEYFSGQFDHLKTTIKKFDLVPSQSKIITIAGTNGKGQTSRLVASLFSNHGKSYGLWTSPHLKTVCERLVFNDAMIEAEDLVKTFEKLKDMLGESLTSYSYFEFIFLSFLLFLKSHPVEYVILEVGLGGRLDATNAVDTDIACVVSISREHQRLLGETYQKILYEKLGIARAHKPLVTAFELDYLQQKTQYFATNLDAQWIDLFKQNKLSKADHFTLRNTRLAEELYFFATGERVSIKPGSESFSKRKTVELNALTIDMFPTHNLDGFRKLFQFLAQQQYNNYDYLLISFSEREWKDLLAICKLIVHHFGTDRVKLVPFHHIKAIKKSRLEKLASEFGFDIIKWETFVQHKSSIQSKVLVSGSNYFLGDLLQNHLGRQ